MWQCLLLPKTQQLTTETVALNIIIYLLPYGK